MQSAFLAGVFPPPTSSPHIFTGHNGTCTWCTTDAWKPFFVKCVDGNTICFYKLLNVFQRPAQQRVVLNDLIMLVPLHSFHLTTISRLFSTNAGNPHRTI